MKNVVAGHLTCYFLYLYCLSIRLSARPPTATSHSLKESAATWLKN